MHVTPIDILAAAVAGVAASIVGGYFGGTTLATKDLGRDFAGYLGMLYGPAAGTTGVVIGLVAVAIIGSRG